MKFRGRTKSKQATWIRSGGRTGRWHRIDPTDGRRAACGTVINELTWSLPQSEFPTLSDTEVLCKLLECRGTD
jgi:hypothetical protein